MKKHSLLDTHLGYWLRMVSNHVSASFAKRLSSESMGIGEWVILNLLSEHGVMSPAEIAAQIGITRGATTKLVDRLSQSELIIRKESLLDRRFQEITLSQKGKTLLPSLIDLAQQNENDFFSHLDEDQKQNLMAIFKQIASMKKFEIKPIN